jgi:hypothetical protein
MARNPTGQVIEDPRRAGVFGLRFRAYGKRRYQGLGRVTPEQAEQELANVLADVRRGIWQPPAPVAEVEAPREIPTFHEFASEWWDAKKRELRPNTVADYEWRLSNHLLPHFAWHPLSRITVQEVDRYRQAKVREGVLSAESINKTLTMLAAVLEQAVEYELIDRNPAVGKRRRSGPASHVAATWTAPARSARYWVRRVRSTRGQRRAIPVIATFAGARCWQRSRSPGCGSGSCSRCAGATSTWAPGGCVWAKPRRTPGGATCGCCRRCATNSPS